MRAHHVPLQQLEAKLVKRYQEERAALFQMYEDQKVILRRECHEEKAMLLRRYEERKSMSLKRSQEMQTMLLNRIQQQKQPGLAITSSASIGGGHFPGTDFDIEEMLQIREALRLMVRMATVSGPREISPTNSTQDGLNKIAQGHEFTTVLQEVVHARGLQPDNVMAALRQLYWKVSMPLQFYGGPIAINSGSCRGAALVAIFKFQSRWPDSIDWYEEE